MSVEYSGKNKFNSNEKVQIFQRDSTGTFVRDKLSVSKKCRNVNKRIT